MLQKDVSHRRRQQQGAEGKGRDRDIRLKVQGMEDDQDRPNWLKVAPMSLTRISGMNGTPW